MLLKDIMTKDVLTLSPNDSLEKAAELFVEHGISGAPVIDAFNNVIGMLTEGDLFDGAIPVNLKKIQNEVEERGATTVAQLMTQDVVSLHEYDPVSEAADYMIEKNINRVPVINDEGQLLGIVTRHDIVRATYLEHHRGADAVESDE